MKRKNILKFISLLGIGSFVSLAVASCGQVATPNPEPPKPVEPSNPTNPNDDAAKQLADAKSKLSQLISSKDVDIAKYDDYAKIKATLTAAYETAQSVSNKSDATLMNVQSATTTLESAIKSAAKAKTDFDDMHGDLVTAYNELKTTLKSKETILSQLSDTKYSAINKHLVGLYDDGQKFLTATLDPTDGMIPEVNDVTSANTAITSVIENLTEWKTNADMLSDNFLKKTLDKEKWTNDTRSQPANYSFVGYSKDITNSNYNFAKRIVWKPQGNSGTSYVALENQDNLTDVSWIYSLAGEGTKYTLEFTYYGPTTAYLYFPYKLVKNEDATKFGLQYKLNDADAKMIQFTQAPATNETTGTNEATAQPSGVQAAGEGSAQSSSSMTLVADQETAATTEMNPTPTVGDINVAKVTLSNLKFGSNKIEFSVPADKVTPMIGNMYLTSSADNQNKVYDDIFGNTLNKQNKSTSVSVDLLRGYSLAADHSTFFYRFMSSNNSNEMQENAYTYLVGFIGGSNPRNANNVSTLVRNPSTTGATRTLTIYVNAPENGQYYVKGSYLTSNNRGLKFSTGDATNSSVTITVTGKNNWNTLGNFDTDKGVDIQKTGSSSDAEQNATNTIKLNKGLNKIVIAGSDSGEDAPYIGNLTFTLTSKSST
ncbi:FIVAR domain-containing protein [[Mycoplasma] imitans]|uniref:FIVAR domain-containing protein n=1 Tax=[Mycoplasma] imitans TaxID=29560 RepID=UPI000482E22D|nr:FIVAR domain-containing protein [[Mycoplasma] imitans]